MPLNNRTHDHHHPHLPPRPIWQRRPRVHLFGVGDSVAVGGVGVEYNWYNINFDEMKIIITLTLFLCSIVTLGQTKLTDSTIKAWSVNDKIGVNTLATQSTIEVRKPDTIECYFLKVPAVIEFPLQAIGAQWYMGYCVSDYNSWHSSYLYLNKAPVKEQVLISIPKQSK